MSTLKQIAANRRNAEASTGPSTPEGKQRSSRNALKSGIYADALVIPGEDPNTLAQLTAEYHARFRPTNPEARDLVDSVVRHAWLLRRLAQAEAAIFNCDCRQCEKRFTDGSDNEKISGRYAIEIKKLDLLQRRVNATERNYHRSLRALLDLTAEPSDAPADAPIDNPEPEPAPGPQLVPDPSTPAQPIEPNPHSLDAAFYGNEPNMRPYSAGHQQVQAPPQEDIGRPE